jgi:hypothetical protein
VLTNVGEVENHPANPILKEVIGQQLTQKGRQELAGGADLQIQVTVLTDTTPQLEAVVFAYFPGDWSPTQVASLGRYNRTGTLCLNLIDHRAFDFTNASCSLGDTGTATDSTAICAPAACTVSM